jgi:hypothetical protein
MEPEVPLPSSQELVTGTTFGDADGNNAYFHTCSFQINFDIILTSTYVSPSLSHPLFLDSNLVFIA